MRTRLAPHLLVFLLIASACSDDGAADTTSSSTSTSSTTLATTTSSTAASTTTSSTTTTTTTTLPEDTTTTSEGAEETTTTTRGDPSTTTTEPPADADPDLVEWAGIFRQPTVWTGFLDFQANGVIRAGNSIDDLPITGRWDYDEENRHFIFSDFDFGDGCNGAQGIYERESAFGGGRRIILVEDPCEARVAFLVQPGSECQCFVYNQVEKVVEDDA